MKVTNPEAIAAIEAAANDPDEGEHIIGHENGLYCYAIRHGPYTYLVMRETSGLVLSSTVVLKPTAHTKDNTP